VRVVRTAFRAIWALAGLLVLVVGTLPAQESQAELERSRQRLEQIRREREQLQQQQSRLRGQVTDVGAELRNLERQREATNRLVNEIERQIGGLGSQLERSSAELALAQDNLIERRAVLQRRLSDIYKRGPLYTFQVLLAAESFGDLLTRYKYLYLTSRQDKALVGDVERLTGRVRSQRNDLLGIQSELDRRRLEREAELERYANLAQQRTSRLRDLQRTTTQTQQRLTALERDEARLNDLLASLERARRAAGANRAAPVGGGLTTADLGRLDWPVDGNVVFQFGRESLPTGGVIIRNGIGIGAATGTAVKAVEAGSVVLRQNLGTYGLTLIVEHGNGYYSLYAQLASAAVPVGATITRSQVIGTVGGQASDHGPHLYFEIRGQNQIALDPTAWLRGRR
jgi:septal ring factor EnvC (AmiA/AmiB activator)